MRRLKHPSVYVWIGLKTNCEPISMIKNSSILIKLDSMEKCHCLLKIKLAFELGVAVCF